MEKELHKRVVSQDEAVMAISKAVRRSRSGLKDPKRPTGSFIFAGPTGVGKTEIARRLSKLAGSPFFKVEATKFTEVGYVGRDVESMVRDLMEIGINLVKSEEMKNVQVKAEHQAEERLLDLLLPPQRPRHEPRPPGSREAKAPSWGPPRVGPTALHRR